MAYQALHGVRVLDLTNVLAGLFCCHQLAHISPTLIYCAISGFGQIGPLRVGYPVAETIGGMTAAFAVALALALADAQRSSGVFIDVLMLEATMATMGWAVSDYLVAGQAPQAMGNDNVTARPSGTFRTGDGLLNIAANKQQQFEAVCRVLDLPELIVDPRFAERQGRLQHRAALKDLIESALQGGSSVDWWHRLNLAGVPAGPVYNVPQALAHAQIAERGMVGEFADAPGVGRDIRLVRTGFKLNGEAPAVAMPPPTLGQHSDEILAELGYDAAAIAALKQEQAV